MVDATPSSARRPTCVVEVELDVSWLGVADMAAIDALARLQAVAHRCGGSIRLHCPPHSLIEMLELVGLGEIIPPCDCPSGGAPEDGAPDDGASDDGAPDDGASGDGASGY